MCFTLSKVHSSGRWNWDGDEIINTPIITSARTLPGTKTSYDIDIREFLLIKDNAIVARALGEILDELPNDEKILFRSRRSGSFDFRVRVIIDNVSRRFHHKPGDRKYDAWLFPDETFANRGGDCEDRAFLLASLLLASGISGYVVRIALGKVYNEETRTSFDHVWVMYRNEAGIWMRLEPLIYSPQATMKRSKIAAVATIDRTKRYEYIPLFAFNDAHMWRFKSNVEPSATLPDYLGKRKFWKKYNPAFAMGIHLNLIDTALQAMKEGDRRYVSQLNIELDGPSGYSPLDHFDNAYIVEGWQLLQQRIKSKGNLNEFAYAVHSIADFYAHTSYAQFAKRPTTNKIALFDGSPQNIISGPNPYDVEPFKLSDATRFSINPFFYKDGTNRNAAIKYCTKMKIISGRYAQTKDPYQGWWEQMFYYIPYRLRTAPGFSSRGALPHHNEIAVDAPAKNGTIPADHRLYTDSPTYQKQFNVRVDAARRHIVELYKQWSSE